MTPDSVSATADILLAMGGLGGLAAFVTALAGLRKTKKIDSQLSPDHGKSALDRLNQIHEMVRSQGHQLGEQHRILMNEVEERQALATRADLEHARLQDQIDRVKKQ